MLEKPIQCTLCPLYKEGIGFQQNCVTHPDYGPPNPKAVFIGEALGYHEANEGLPFVGDTGQMLRKMMRQADIEPNEVYITNVVKCRPPGNRTPTSEEIKFCADNYLEKELAYHQPNVIVPVGGTALKLLAPHLPGVMRARGYVHQVEPWGKVIPIVHPSFVARGNQQFWSVTVVDLLKIRREWDSPTVRTYKENFNIQPSVADVRAFIRSVRRDDLPISWDIETFGNPKESGYLYNANLACIGFATSIEDAICIPFLRCGGYPYWQSSGEEEEVVELIAELFEDTRVIKIGQNIFPFDMPFLMELGFKFDGTCHDTLTMHHVAAVELKHSLEFMTSIYTDRFHHKSVKVTIWTPDEVLRTYNCRDCVATMQVYQQIDKEITEG